MANALLFVLLLGLGWLVFSGPFWWARLNDMWGSAQPILSFERKNPGPTRVMRFLGTPLTAGLIVGGLYLAEARLLHQLAPPVGFEETFRIIESYAGRRGAFLTLADAKGNLIKVRVDRGTIPRPGGVGAPLNAVGTRSWVGTHIEALESLPDGYAGQSGLPE